MVDCELGRGNRWWRPTTFRTKWSRFTASPFATPRWITRCICIPRTGECCPVRAEQSASRDGIQTPGVVPGGTPYFRGIDGDALLDRVTWKAFAGCRISRVVAPATVAVYEEVEEVVADRGSSNLADRARVAGAGDIGQDAGGVELVGGRVGRKRRRGTG